MALPARAGTGAVALLSMREQARRWSGPYLVSAPCPAARTPPVPQA